MLYLCYFIFLLWVCAVLSVYVWMGLLRRVVVRLYMCRHCVRFLLYMKFGTRCILFHIWHNNKDVTYDATVLQHFYICWLVAHSNEWWSHRWSFLFNDDFGAPLTFFFLIDTRHAFDYRFWWLTAKHIRNFCELHRHAVRVGCKSCGIIPLLSLLLLGLFCFYKSFYTYSFLLHCAICALRQNCLLLNNASRFTFPLPPTTVSVRPVGKHCYLLTLQDVF